MLLFLPSIALAQSVTVLAHSISVQKISSEIVAENEEELVRSVSGVLQKHSQETGHEACAQ